MLRRSLVGLAFVAALMPQFGAAQMGSDTNWAWPAGADSPAAFRQESTVPLPRMQSERRTLAATLLGSAAGATATLLYFAVRDEDRYECNACAERALVAGLTTGIGTGMGAQWAGAGWRRSALSSIAGTVVGSLVGLALIEPLSAGWPAGGVGYVLAQGLTTGLIAHAGRE